MKKLVTIITILFISLFLMLLSSAAQKVLYVSTIGSDSSGDGSIEDPFYTIQKAINTTGSGDTVIVMEGRYTGPGNRNLNFRGKAITVRSSDPDDNECMRKTIIDAEGIGIIVRFINDEGLNSWFEGFTLFPGDTSVSIERGTPGLFEFSIKSRPTTRRLRLGSTPHSSTQTLFLYPNVARDLESLAKWEPPPGERLWDHLNPFYQPAHTTDYWGSGDVDNDGEMTRNDASLAHDMAQHKIAPSPRADVDGNGVVDVNDAVLIEETFDGANLPGWWNQLTDQSSRNAWISKIIDIDRTDEHWYMPEWFVCSAFANQTFMNFALNRIDIANLYWDRYSGGQTIFNVPLYSVSTWGHAINGILVGDDPLNFHDWRFIEPQNDQNVIPGQWNMPYNNRVSIIVPQYYDGWSIIGFRASEEDCCPLEHFNSDLILTRPGLPTQPPDNRSDLWNPRVIPNGAGTILFEKMRSDMSRVTDIHAGELLGKDLNIAGPLIMDSYASRLLDISQGPDGTYHIVWSGRSDCDKPECDKGIFHGEFDPQSNTVKNVTWVVSQSKIHMARVIVTSDNETHIVWTNWYWDEKGIFWTRWNGAGWQPAQNLTPSAGYPDSEPNWVNRNFRRYYFDATSLNEGSEIVLVWAENSQLRERHFDGTVWWDAHQISEEDNVRGIDLVTDSQGTVHLSYWLGDKQEYYTDNEEGRGILLHRTYDETSWSEPVTVDSSNASCCPRMAAGFGSEVYMVWERREEQWVIPVWSKCANGIWHTSEKLNVNTGTDAWYPTVDVLPDSKVVFTWSSRSPDYVSIEQISEFTLSVINDLVTFEPDPSTYALTPDTTGCDQISFSLDILAIPDTPTHFGTKNVPHFTLTNNSSQASIDSFHFTIGDTTRNFDFVDILRTGGIDFELMAPNLLGAEDTVEDFRSDYLNFMFLEGFSPNTVFKFAADIDIDNVGSREDFTQVFFNNGDASNSVITVGFSTGNTLSLELPESPSVVSGTDIYRFVQGPPYGEFAGKFSFDATLTNISEKMLSNLFVEVDELTNYNLLLTNNDLIDKDEQFKIPKIDDYSDGVLSPDEYVDVHFCVCLKNKESFRLFVDVLGTASGIPNDNPGSAKMTSFDLGADPKASVQSGEGSSGGCFISTQPLDLIWSPMSRNCVSSATTK